MDNILKQVLTLSEENISEIWEVAGYIPNELMVALAIYKRISGKSFSKIVREALEQYLENKVTIEDWFDEANPKEIINLPLEELLKEDSIWRKALEEYLHLPDKNTKTWIVDKP